MIQSLNLWIWLTVLVLFFESTDVTSGESSTCDFVTGQAPNITLICFFPKEADVPGRDLTVYLQKKSDTDPISVVDCMRDEKEDTDCEVKPGYYYDKVMYTNHTSIQVLNASDTHLGTYYCQLMGSALQPEKCELTAQHLVPETTAELGSEDFIKGTRDQESTTTHPAGDTNSEREKRDFILAIAIGGSALVLVIVIAAVLIIRFCYIKRCFSNLRLLPSIRKETPKRLENNSTTDEARERLMDKSADRDVNDMEKNASDVSPPPNRLQSPKQVVDVTVVVESKDNIDGQGEAEKEVPTVQTAGCSRTETESGNISFTTSNTSVRYVPDRPKDPEDKTCLAQAYPKEEPHKGATESQSETVIISLKPRVPETLEEQAMPSNDETQKTTSHGRDAKSREAKDKTIDNHERSITCVHQTSHSAYQDENESPGKVSSKWDENWSLQTPVRTDVCLSELASSLRKIIPSSSGMVNASTEKKIIERIIKPSGDVIERIEKSKARCSLMPISDQDVSISDSKMTEVQQMDETKSVASESHITTEVSGFAQHDIDIPSKTNRKPPLPQNMYDSGGNSTDKSAVPVEEGSYTNNTSSELATEKETENPSSCQKIQNFPTESTSSEPSGKITAQQDIHSFGDNASPEAQSPQEVSEGEGSQNFSFSPSEESKVNVRKFKTV